MQADLAARNMCVHLGDRVAVFPAFADSDRTFYAEAVAAAAFTCEYARRPTAVFALGTVHFGILNGIQQQVSGTV